MWIRIQHFCSMRIQIQIQGIDKKKCNKIINSRKQSFGSKTAVYLSLCLRRGRPSYKRSSKEIMQHFKTMKFLTLFCGLFPPEPGSSRSKSRRIWIQNTSFYGNVAGGKSGNDPGRNLPTCIVINLRISSSVCPENMDNFR
jgi:hypothetical protein